MSDPIRTLNDLVSTCYDSEEGFGKAAKGAHDDGLRTRLTGAARQRADFADELAACVQSLGGKPPDSAHQSGIQQSGWRDLEVSIRPKDDATLIAHCQAGEQNTLRHYEHALGEELPAAVHAVVERHHAAIQATLQDLSNHQPANSAT